MRIPSGVTDQYIYFVAVDVTDLKTRETGLSGFTVYRSRNGGAAASFTTPTVNETDTTNMPGVYELLLDEDMTIDAGDDSQEMVFHITHASMHPVTRTIELYRPKITAGNALAVDASGIGDANLEEIDGDATAAGNLSKSTLAIVTGTVTTGSSTTSVTTSAISPAGTSVDQFAGRIMIFLRDTTTAGLRGEATLISANTAAANPTFTVELLSNTPVSGDTFIIV